MIKKQLLVILLFFYIWSTASIAFEVGEANFGIDLSQSSLTLKPKYGSNIYPKDPAMLGIFVDMAVIDKFGIELGLEAQDKQYRIATVGGGDNISGSSDFRDGQFEIEAASFKSKYIYLGIYHKQPLMYFQQTMISSFLGGAWAKIEAQQNIIDDDMPGLPTQAEIEALRRTFKKSKIVPMLKFTISQPFNQHVGWRISASWRNLAKFKLKSLETPGSNSEIRLNDAYSIGVGIYFNL